MMTILLASGEFAYITDVCNCDLCKARGEVEFTLVDEDVKYIDMIKYHELDNKAIVKHYNPKDLCKLFHEKLLEK